MNFLLIGKPNVGKSSIFNILTFSNNNIVHPEEGTTRDWHKEKITQTNSYIFDTPGVLINNSNNYKKLLDISFSHIINFDKIIFLYVVSYKDGFNSIDNFAINQIRKYNKEIILIINKFDNFHKPPNLEFNKYGMKQNFYISCSHNFGFDNLKSLIKENTNKVDNIPNEDFSFAIFGKPNAGKSTFLNSIVGYNRSLTSPIAGTTSDYVVEHMNYNKKLIKIIDTAGIGKKSNIANKSINFYSIKKTFENIRQVDTAILIIDAEEGIDRQDKRIIKLISGKSKSIIIVFNKFDLIYDKNSFKSDTIADIDNSLSEVKNIKIFFISALKSNNVKKIIDYLFNSIFLKDYSISTSNLNKWLKQTVSNNEHPLIENKRVNFKYAVQIKKKPVTIKILSSYSYKLKANYKKYLINNFNKHFRILNQKIKIIFTSSKNPYI